MTSDYFTFGILTGFLIVAWAACIIYIFNKK